MADNIYTATEKHGDKMREKIRDYMVEYISQNGYPPSVREIGAAVGLSSPSSVQFHLYKMYQEKMIETDADEQSPRAYRVCGYRFIKGENIPVPINETDRIILDAVIQYILSHGYSPTFREISSLSGLTSTKTIFEHVYAMVEQGLLKIGPRNSTRTISVTGLKYVEDTGLFHFI